MPKILPDHWYEPISGCSLDSCQLLLCGSLLDFPQFAAAWVDCRNPSIVSLIPESGYWLFTSFILLVFSLIIVSSRTGIGILWLMTIESWRASVIMEDQDQLFWKPELLQTSQVYIYWRHWGNISPWTLQLNWRKFLLMLLNLVHKHVSK